jgi:hypothetical protein
VVVAFIDILGFKNRLLSVKKNSELLKAYSVLLRLQEIFEKNSKDEFGKEARKYTAKKILGLSDALVVALDLKSPLVDSMGVLDTIAAELHSLAFNQAIAVTEGVFLRGGIAKGFFYSSHRRDIVISNALALAYDVEENEADYPILAIEEEFYKYFVRHSGNKVYSDAIAPCNTLFYSYRRNKKVIYFLDYLAVGFSCTEDWAHHEDLVAYRNEKDPDLRHAILCKSYRLNQSRFIMAHKKAIEKELRKKYPLKIKRKYLWLKRYHNQFVKVKKLSKKHFIS